jgi:hypothetical protein
MVDLQWDMHLLDLHAGALPPRLLRGVVDRTSTAELEPRLVAHVESARGARVVLDCVELDTIDEDGLAMLERVMQRTGKRLQLINLGTECALDLRAHPLTPALELL